MIHPLLIFLCNISADEQKTNLRYSYWGYCIKRERLKSVHSIKYLRVQFTATLKWNLRVRHTLKKTKLTLSFLRRYFKHLAGPPEDMHLLFERTISEYPCTVLSPHTRLLANKNDKKTELLSYVQFTYVQVKRKCDCAEAYAKLSTVIVWAEKSACKCLLTYSTWSNNKLYDKAPYTSF